MQTEDRLVLNYDARAENVALARAAVGAMGAGLGMVEPRLGDLKTIVTEACANVVRHAYPEEPGRFEVEAFPEEGELAVRIRDFGTGPDGEATARDEDSMGIGLGLILELSNHFEIADGAEGGTVVQMRIRLAP